MIRQAVESDRELLLAMWKEGYSGTPFAAMEYNADYVEVLFNAILHLNDGVFCKVVESKGVPVGILIGILDSNFWGVPTAQAIVSYSQQETDKLLRQFTTWAKEKGAKQVTITTVTGKEKYRNLIELLGFKESGKLYTKEV